MMLRTLIILYMSVILTPLASAEIYRWEDENGIHLTDSPSSVPEKYREKVYAETSKQIRNSTPQSRVGITQQYRPVPPQTNQAAIYQANIEQQRRAAYAIKQQQARSLVASNKKVNSAFHSLARFMAFWFMLGFIIFIAWIATIVDIVRSEFTSPSNKTVWVLLVLLLPLLGMLLYYLIGLSQKDNSKGYRNKQQEELLVRLYPKDPKDKDFVI